MVFFKAHHIISDFIVIKNAISKRFSFYVYMVLVIKFNGERNKEKAHVCIQLFRDLCHHVPMFWEDENISGTYGEARLTANADEGRTLGPLSSIGCIRGLFLSWSDCNLV